MPTVRARRRTRSNDSSRQPAAVTADVRPAVFVKPRSQPGTASKWQQSERWFWLTHPETGQKELVKPEGTVHQQGPHSMVRYATQDGAVKTCSVAFFETNTMPWSRTDGLRAPADARPR